MKIKAKELRKLNQTELSAKLLELQKNLMKANAQIASGTVPENPGNVKNIKKSIARIALVSHERLTQEAKK